MLSRSRHSAFCRRSSKDRVSERVAFDSSRSFLASSTTCETLAGEGSGLVPVNRSIASNRACGGSMPLATTASTSVGRKCPRGVVGLAISCGGSGVRRRWNGAGMLFRVLGVLRSQPCFGRRASIRSVRGLCAWPLRRPASPQRRSRGGFEGYRITRDRHHKQLPMSVKKFSCSGRCQKVAMNVLQ